MGFEIYDQERLALAGVLQATKAQASKWVEQLTVEHFQDVPHQIIFTHLTPTLLAAPAGSPRVMELCYKLSDLYVGKPQWAGLVVALTNLQTYPHVPPHDVVARAICTLEHAYTGRSKQKLAQRLDHAELSAGEVQQLFKALQALDDKRVA